MSPLDTSIATKRQPPAPEAAPTVGKARLLRALELALVFVCGAVMWLSVARRRERSLILEPLASAVVDVTPPPIEPPALAPAASAWPEGTGDEAASCSIPDRGRGRYGEQQGLPIGVMIAPPIEGDHYDVLLHFHGGEAVRRVVAPLDRNLVIVTVDAGVGSKAYSEAFYGPEPLEEVLEAVGQRMGTKLLRHLIVSSWSAGYGAVREILVQHPATPNAVVLLDSVHAGYQPDGETLVEAGLGPFVSLVARAALGETTVVLTHSDIQPPNFASTTEVANYLLGTLGGQRSYAGLIDTFGVEHKTSFERGSFILRGYTGTDKGAHCAHLKMLGNILERDVLPRLEASHP